MKNNNLIYKYLFIFSALLVHFDPTKSSITIAIFFIPLFGYKYLRLTFTKYTPFILLGISFFFPFINLLIFESFYVSYLEFLKTYILYIVAAVVHIYIVYSPLKKENFCFENSNTIVLIFILIITSLQFFGSIFFNNTLFYNIFGDFQYKSMGNIESLTSGIFPRTKAFYLEPSYLAFVTITLISINLLNKYRIKFTLIIGCLIIFMSGSRGGFLGYFLLLAWSIYSSSINKKIQLRIGYNILLFFIIVFFAIFSPLLVLFSSESLSTENTSQYFRIFTGFQLSNYILSHFIFGVPLGSIEDSFSNFLGIENTSYSFFFLNIFYHGWVSFLLLLLLLLSTLQLKIENKYKFLLFIYLLLYFNMTGSLLAPDTYFWFFCFYYTFRLTTNKNLNNT